MRTFEEVATKLGYDINGEFVYSPDNLTRYPVNELKSIIDSGNHNLVPISFEGLAKGWHLASNSETRDQILRFIFWSMGEEDPTPSPSPLTREGDNTQKENERHQVMKMPNVPESVICPDCHKPMKLNLHEDSLEGVRYTVWDCLNCGNEFNPAFAHPEPDVIFDTINSMIGFAMAEPEFNDFVGSPTHAVILGHIAAGKTLEEAIKQTYK